MKRAAYLVLASMVASALACSEVIEDPNGSGGGTPVTTSGGPSTTGTMTTTSSSSTSSTASSASTGTGGADCPDVTCEVTCDYGYWDDLEGCQTCACAPPPIELSTNGFMHDPQHVTLMTTADEYIGGVNRWVFNFTWSYDDPGASDDAIVVEATVRLMRDGDPSYEPTETNMTWASPSGGPSPLELMGGEYTLYGFGIVNDSLAPVSGWLSIRRVDDVFEGGVVLEMEGDGAAGDVHAAGPFSVPVP